MIKLREYESEWHAAIRLQPRTQALNFLPLTFETYGGHGRRSKPLFDRLITRYARASQLPIGSIAPSLVRFSEIAQTLRLCYG